MQFRRQKQHEENINLTPLIDVVFLLLIFFMVSTTFTKESHLKLQLPEAQGEAAPDQVESIEITISVDGAYSVNGDALINSQLSTLMNAIDQVGDGNISLPIIITADAKVPYESVVAAMDAVSRLGYSNLSMTTTQPKDDP